MFFVIDVETNGFHPIKNDVITLGLEVVDGALNTIDSFYLKMKPDIFKWMNDDNIGFEVHKITLAEMACFPERRESLIELLHFLKKYKCPHNSTRPLFYHALNGFDYLFLEWAFRKEEMQYSLWKIFDFPHSHSTILLGRSLGYEGNSLKEWSKRIGKEKFNHHNALDDALMCGNILRYINKTHFNNDVDELFKHLERVKANDLQKVQEKEVSTGFFNL